MNGYTCELRYTGDMARVGVAVSGYTCELRYTGDVARVEVAVNGYTCELRYVSDGRVGAAVSGCTCQGARTEAVPVSGRGCPDLGTLPDVTVTELYKGGILQFTCPQGMRREGPQKLMCDGTNWDQEPPRCLCKLTGLSTVLPPFSLCRLGCTQFSSGRSVSVSWAAPNSLPAALSLSIGLPPILFRPFCLCH